MLTQRPKGGRSQGNKWVILWDAAVGEETCGTVMPSHLHVIKQVKGLCSVAD